jgi:hypothetical protein
VHGMGGVRWALALGVVAVRTTRFRGRRSGSDDRAECGWRSKKASAPQPLDKRPGEELDLRNIGRDGTLRRRLIAPVRNAQEWDGTRHGLFPPSW